MKLSKSSWHYKLNLFYVYEHYNIPSNLCPYFWRTVWYALVLVPALILSVPSLILIIFTKYKWEGLVRETGMGSLIICAISILVSMIAMWWFIPSKDGDLGVVFVVFGGIGWVIVLMGGIVKLAEWRTKRAYNRGPGLIASFLKAKKEKLCPRIEWEEKL